jgi:hypothetical protein
MSPTVDQFGLPGIKRVPGRSIVPNDGDCDSQLLQKGAVLCRHAVVRCNEHTVRVAIDETLEQWRVFQAASKFGYDMNGVTATVA